MASGADPARSRMPRARRLLRRLVVTAGLTLGATTGILLGSSAAQAEDGAPGDTSIVERAVTSAVDLTRPLVSGSARKPAPPPRRAEPGTRPARGAEPGTRPPRRAESSTRPTRPAPIRSGEAGTRADGPNGPSTRPAPSRSAEAGTRADGSPGQRKAAVATPVTASAARSVHGLATTTVDLSREPVLRILESAERTGQPVGKVAQELAPVVAPIRHLVSGAAGVITGVVPAVPGLPTLPGAPGLPDVPALPEIPGLPDKPGTGIEPGSPAPERAPSAAPDHEAASLTAQPAAARPLNLHHGSGPASAAVRPADPHHLAPSERDTRPSPGSPSPELPAPVPSTGANAGQGGMPALHADVAATPRTVLPAGSARAMRDVRAPRGASDAPDTRPG